VLRRILTIAAVLTVALLATAPAAHAHTQMTETIPNDGDVLDATPPQVVVVFNDAIREDRSSVVVLDEAGTTVAEGGLDPADATRLVADLPPLGNGTYTVRWTAYSADNELIRDQFAFEVAIPATPTPAPTPTPTAEPSASPTPTAPPATTEATTAPSPSPSAPPGDEAPGDTGVVQILIPLIVGGAIVAGVALLLIRRRQA
jgi:methionine-rich copper-binding protein CopC